MKTINQKQHRYFVSVRLSRGKSRIIAIFMSLLILNLCVSCSYYKVRDVSLNEDIAEQVNAFNKEDKYVVLHSNRISWHLKDMVINEDEQTISGIIALMDTNHQYKKSRDSKRVHLYSRAKQSPLNEVHFYLKSTADFTANSNVSIPLSEIDRISVNDKNTGRSIANVVLTTVGVIFVVAVIILATKSSCPFVYVKNGKEYEFVGELYPGTITSNMQKDDYLSLPNVPIKENEYVLKVTNQLKEIQYTDHLQLISVSHDKDVEVLLDKKGKLQSFQKLEKPTKTIIDGTIGDEKPVLEKDFSFYAFNTPKATPNSIRDIVFEFDKPKGDNDAKLYLTAKNSVWLDYIYGKFNEKFGSYYNTFQKDQQEISGKNIESWINGQNIPLSVFVKTNKGWQLVDRINTVGPMAMRDIVVPLNLDEIVGDKLQIKLETGFMFWEVDYVRVDFTENLNLEVDYTNISRATDQYGNNVTKLLAEADQVYFAQPNIGDEVEISFPIKEAKDGLGKSFFLKNRGYYNYIREYEGLPDIEYLKSFRKDHVFTEFSEKAYLDFVNFDINTFTHHE